MIFQSAAEAREYLAANGITSAVVMPTTHAHFAITGRRKPRRQICSICQEPFPEFSSNAEPVNNGRCCAYCDLHVVTPARIRLAERSGYANPGGNPSTFSIADQMDVEAILREPKKGESE